MMQPRTDSATFRLTVAASCLLLASSIVGPVSVRGQDIPPTEPPRAAAEPASPATPAVKENGRLRAAELETYYLKDKDGNLIPYVNIPFEDFEEAYKLYKKFKVPEQPRRYVLQEVSLTGVVRGKVAALDVTCKILTTVAGEIRVPLQFKGAALQPADPQDNSEELFIDYDHDRDGFVCWLTGEPGITRTVHLKLVTNITQTGDESRLSLDVPRATISRLRLNVPGASVEADASEDAILADPKPLADNASELFAEGLSGGFHIAWREARKALPESPPALHVDGVVLARFESSAHVRCEASLGVRSRNGKRIESFRVRAPLGMRFVPFDQPGFRARLVPPGETSATGPADAAPMVEVTLEEKATVVDDVRLLFESTRTPAQLDLPVEIAGFEVLGATLQTWHLNLAVDEGWLAKWTPGGDLRQVSEIAEPLRREGVLARFEYYRQPASLKVRVLPKQTLVNVEPKYVFQVDARQVRMEAHLSYAVRGAMPTRVTVAIADWVVDEVVAKNGVSVSGTDLVETGIATVSLIPSIESSVSEFELLLTAHREIPPGQTKVSFPLPHPAASSTAPADVLVQAAENVEITPLPDEIKGLVPDSTAARAAVQNGLPAPLAYRDGGIDVAMFVGGFRVRKGEVSVAISGELRIGDQKIDVRQRLSYQIAYEPLNNVTLDVPRSLVDSRTLKVSLAGTDLTWQPITAPAGPAATDDRRRIDVDLQGSRRGTLPLEVSFSQPWVLPKADEPVTDDVLLVQAHLNGSTRGSDGVTFTSLQVDAPLELQLTLDSSAWSTGATTVSDGVGHHLFDAVSKVLPTKIVLTIALDPSAAAPSTVVQKAWIQTWLSDDERQDRATFRITTREPQIRISLPPGATLDEIGVDGRRIDPQSLWHDEMLVIETPAVSEENGLLVELWYSFSEGRPQRGLIDVRLPQLQDTRWTKRVFWQLVLPTDEHLISAPVDLTPELTWTRQGVYFGRRASMLQEDLESWIGASRQTPLPVASNQYVFSSFGPLDQFSVRTALRRDVLLGVSLIALLIGLLLIYYQPLRRPAALFVASLAAVVASVLYPQPALQIVQTASLGLAFVVLAVLLKWLVARPRPRSAIVRGSSLSTHDANTTETHFATPEMGSHKSTGSGSVAIRLTDPSSRT